MLGFKCSICITLPKWCDEKWIKTNIAEDCNWGGHVPQEVMMPVLPPIGSHICGNKIGNREMRVDDITFDFEEDFPWLIMIDVSPVKKLNQSEWKKLLLDLYKEKT